MRLIKTAIYLFSIFLIAGTPTAEAKTKRSSTIKMTDAVINFLSGPVKQVTIRTDYLLFVDRMDSTQTTTSKPSVFCTMDFDRNGYLTRTIIDGDTTFYSNRTKDSYTMTSCSHGERESTNYRIKYMKNKRIDTIVEDDSSYEEYQFTNTGQLQFVDSYIDISWGYKYIYDKPYTLCPIADYGYGSDVSYDISKFKYLEFDSHGNWITRKEIYEYGVNGSFDDQWRFHQHIFGDNDFKFVYIPNPLKSPIVSDLWVHRYEMIQTRAISYY